MEALLVYGTSWCPDVARSKALLDELGITYELIDVDHDAAANARCAELNGGVRRVPTIVFPSGQVAIEPSDGALKEMLEAEALT